MLLNPPVRFHNLVRIGGGGKNLSRQFVRIQGHRSDNLPQFLRSRVRASHGQSRGRIRLKRIPCLRSGQRNGSTHDENRNLFQKSHDDPPSESGFGIGPDIHTPGPLCLVFKFRSGYESQPPYSFVSGGKCLNIFTTPLLRFLIFLSALPERVSLVEPRQISFFVVVSNRSTTRVPTL